MTTPRRPARLRRRVRVTIGGAPAFTQNLGEGGFAAEIMRTYAPGTEIQGTLQLGGIDVAYAGRVAWVKPGDPRVQLRGRVGVRFTALSQEALRQIRAGLPAQK